MNLIRYAISGPQADDPVPASEQRRVTAREIEAGLAEIEAERAAAARTAAEARAAALAARRNGDRVGALAQLQVEKGQLHAIQTYDRARARLLTQRVAQTRADSTVRTAQIMRRFNASAAGFSERVDELDDAILEQSTLEDELRRADELLEGEPIDEAEADDMLATLDLELEADLGATFLDAEAGRYAAPPAAEPVPLSLPPNPARARTTRK